MLGSYAILHAWTIYFESSHYVPSYDEGFHRDAHYMIAFLTTVQHNQKIGYVAYSNKKPTFDYNETNTYP